MAGYDYIYGSVVTIQCQEQININEWHGTEDYVDYLGVIKKDKDFFKYWCMLRHAVLCVVEEPPNEELE